MLMKIPLVWGGIFHAKFKKLVYHSKNSIAPILSFLHKSLLNTLLRTIANYQNGYFNVKDTCLT